MQASVQEGVPVIFPSFAVILIGLGLWAVCIGGTIAIVIGSEVSMLVAFAGLGLVVVSSVVLLISARKDGPLKTTLLTLAVVAAMPAMAYADSKADVAIRIDLTRANVALMRHNLTVAADALYDAVKYLPRASDSVVHEMSAMNERVNEEIPRSLADTTTGWLPGQTEAGPNGPPPPPGFIARH